VGPGNHVLDGVQKAPWEGAILRGKGASLVKYRDWTLCGHLCKNSSADRDAVWVMGSDGPMELCVRWGSRYPIGRGSLGGRDARCKV